MSGRLGALRLRADRTATAALVLVELVGLITYLVLGRHLWFYSDEWDYLVDRNIGSDPVSLLRDHNGQWQTIPIIVYRALWHLTRLHTYWPYLALVVVLYLVVCTLLYALLLRARVRPWVAVAFVTLLVFLGFANENVVFGAQISYLGSVAFGLGQLLLLDDRPSTRRSVVIVAFGIAGLMCSNIGVVMAVVTAAAALLRHGWRTAAVLTAPPAAAFIAWWLAFGSGAKSGGATSTAAFVGVGLRAAGEDYSQHGVLGAIVVGVVVLAGLVLAALRRPRWWTAIVPPALGALVFLAVTGSQRADAFGTGTATSPRYVGVVVILLLPVAAVAVDACWDALPVAGAVALVALLIGLPGNVSALSGISRRAEQVDRARALILALPAASGFGAAPGDQRPFPEANTAPLLTVGFLRAAERNGWLPGSGAVSGDVRAADQFRLALYQTDDPRPSGHCRTLSAPAVVQVSANSALRIAGGFVEVIDASDRSLRVYYNPNRGNTLKVLTGTYRLVLSSEGTNGRARLCGS